LSCVIVPLFIVVSFFVLMAIARVTTNSGSWLDQVICYGALSVLVIIMLLGAYAMGRDSLAASAQLEEWKNSCMSAELTIINRHESGSFDDGYRIHSTPCRLELEMNSDQRAVSPNQSGVEVKIDDYIYKRLEKRSTVRIYYRPEAPMTFLLEDEI
jgi:hypothetical protein